MADKPEKPLEEETLVSDDMAATEGGAVETDHDPSQEEKKEEEEPTDKPPKEKEDEIDEMTTLHERTIAALSYFGFLAIVPFYLKKESKFCRFHGKQGLTLAVIFFLAQFVAVLDLIMDLTLILQAIIALWYGFGALAGRWKKVPLIYNWSCQLEEALALKTKEEEAEQLTLKPGEVKEEEGKEDK
ncbi:hypothetical protein JW752_04780 [Candidatus Peregrinibacteria bacterium]|nr:hypothetical protein [Candidatus Peregrinibacteria bacterium]